jgi:hypothetical protein
MLSPGWFDEICCLCWGLALKQAQLAALVVPLPMRGSLMRADRERLFWSQRLWPDALRASHQHTACGIMARDVPCVVTQHPAMQLQGRAAKCLVVFPRQSLAAAPNVYLSRAAGACACSALRKCMCWGAPQPLTLF